VPGPSAIEWTEATWNPVTGCDKVSPGCAHCYAETFAERFRGVPGHPYEQGFDLKLWPSRLDYPRKWKKSKVIFVNSMSDLFHEDVPADYVGEVFEVMANANQHVYQVLTKRHERRGTCSIAPVAGAHLDRRKHREPAVRSSRRLPSSSTGGCSLCLSGAPPREARRAQPRRHPMGNRWG
jgi:hypothetical protein